jgi:hypothetical protein
LLTTFCSCFSTTEKSAKREIGKLSLGKKHEIRNPEKRIGSEFLAKCTHNKRFDDDLRKSPADVANAKNYISRDAS